MGVGELAVGIASEQVRGGSNSMNYNERAKSLGASGGVVRLVGFGTTEGGGASVGDRAPKWYYPCWQG